MNGIQSIGLAGLLLIPASVAGAGLVVNEVMADNRATVADGEGDFDDWLEIYNTGGVDVDLRGHFVSDDADDVTKWMIGGGEALVVPAGGYALLWADGDPEDGGDHLPFRLAAEGDEFILTAPDGVTVIDQVELPGQHADISFGRSEDGSGTFRYLVNPTPGAANDPLGVAVLEGVGFSRDGGTFVDGFELALTTSSDGAVIRYTLDGTVPTAATGVAYGGPVAIDRTTCVRARLFLGERPISPVATRVYLGLDGALAGFDSNLPIVLIDSQGYRYDRDNDPRQDYPATAVCAGFFEVGDGGRASAVGAPQYLGRAGMNVRGASSKTWPKKQFKFETWDEGDNDLEVSLLGMPADADWILHAPYFDKSLMRNEVVYHWWRELGYYSPRTRFVEVFLNTERAERFAMEHYQGVYVLTEKIKRGAERMDIERLDADDVAEPEITGGYIAQATNINEDWVSREGTRYKYVEPSITDGLEVQKRWFRDYVEAAERSVYARNFADPDTGYAKYLDVPSQIDYDIVRELSRNADGASTFFSIKRGGKLKMGPLWDYNQALGLSSLGNASLGNSWETAGWNLYYMNAAHWLAWWGKLEEDPNYQRAWHDRWVELRESTFATGRVLGRIDAVAALLDEAQVRNFETWDILGRAVWVVNGKSRADPGDLGRDTYAKEVGFLRDWVEERLEWIDSQVPSPPDFNRNGGAVAQGFQLEMGEGTGFAPFAGDVYFTLDGTDPAGAAGVPVRYEVPVALGESVRVMARTRDVGTGRWGALRDVSFIVGAEAPSRENLTISEIHYNPDGPDDLEFIEIANRGAAPVDLTGVRLATAVDFEFGALDLPPGAGLVVVEDERKFRAVFGDDVLVAGQWSGRLDNAGETIDVLDAEGGVLHRVSYGEDGDWPSGADGQGFSLQQWDVGSDPSDPSSWRLSSFENGSPGVLPPADPLTFEAWQEAQFSAAQIGQAEVGGMLADPDGDGLVNLIEFGFARNALEVDRDPLVSVAVEDVVVAGAGTRALTLTFRRPSRIGARFVLQTSMDLLDWEDRPSVLVRSSREEGSEIETLTVTAKDLVGDHAVGSSSHARILISP